MWLAQVTRQIGRATRLGTIAIGSRRDPDVDDSRDYMMQLMWYGQGLERLAWSNSGAPVPIEKAPNIFTGQSFFTDGYRVVLWISGDPVSMLELHTVDWDEAPLR